MSKWMTTILLLIASAFLTRWIPFSSFFRNIDTMIHEFGHAAVTLLLSGQVMNIDLNADHSGLTRSLVSQRWAMVPVALAGYVTASLFAWYLFSLYARRRHRFGLILISLLAVVNLLLFVRNSFGMAWLGGFIVVNSLFAVLGIGAIGRYYFLLIAFICLEESVFGPVTLLVLAWTDSARAGDASLLSQVLPVPAWGWALAFTLFALWCAKQAITAFIGGRRTRRSAPSDYSIQRS